MAAKIWNLFFDVMTSCSQWTSVVKFSSNADGFSPPPPKKSQYICGPPSQSYFTSRTCQPHLAL